MQVARAYLEAWSRRPLPRLVLHFVASILRGGSRSEESSLEIGIGALLAVLAVPGAFISIALFEKYSSLALFLKQQARFDVYVASIPDKYFFIVFSMVVTGMVTVIKWDKILPDRQDYINLSPLPIRLKSILIANSAAILITVSLFTLAVNAASILLFPLVVTAGETSFHTFFAFAGTHAVCVLLASVFTFSAIFFLMGTAMAVLPLRVFWPFSRWLRGALVGCFLALLLTSFAGKAILAQYESDPASWLAFAPPVWFVALYQNLQQRGNEALLVAGERALYWTLGSAILAVLVYPLCYRKAYFHAAQPQQSKPTEIPRSRLISSVNRVLNAGSDFDRATFPFVLRVLVRSDAHTLIFGVFFSVGLVLAGQAALQGAPFAAPLIAAYLIITGLRLSFELPVMLGANWVFRTALHSETQGALAVTRKVMLTFIVPVVFVPTLMAGVLGFGVVWGVLHIFCVAMLSLGLIELMLIRWKKLPFTCAMPVFQNSAVMVLILHVLGFALFTSLGAELVRWLLTAPLRAIAFVLFAVAAGLWIRHNQHSNHLAFEDSAEPEVQRLALVKD